MRPVLVFTILAATAAVAVPLAAQQAAPDYDQSAVVTLEGTADTIRWSDTGGHLMLAPATGTQMWDIALPNTNTMTKKNLGANLLTRGASVKVDAYKAKDPACNPNCKAQGVHLTIDGQTYDLLSPVAPDPAPAAGGGRGRRGD